MVLIALKNTPPTPKSKWKRKNLAINKGQPASGNCRTDIPVVSLQCIWNCNNVVVPFSFPHVQLCFLIYIVHGICCNHLWLQDTVPREMLVTKKIMTSWGNLQIRPLFTLVAVGLYPVIQYAAFRSHSSAGLYIAGLPFNLFIKWSCMTSSIFLSKYVEVEIQ